MRAVVDTNVLIAGLLWRGPPHALLNCVREGRIGLVASPALLAELERVLGRAKFDPVLIRAATSRARVMDEIRQLAGIIEPPELAQPVCRDPDDDAILALAIAARVDMIVSGDADLFVLRQFSGIPIVDPAQALQCVPADDPSSPASS